MSTKTDWPWTRRHCARSKSRKLFTQWGSVYIMEGLNFKRYRFDNLYSHSLCLCTQGSVLLSSCTICVQCNAPFLDRVSLGSVFSCHKWGCLKLGVFYHKRHFSVPILVCHKKRKAWREHRNVRTTAEDSLSQIFTNLCTFIVIKILHKQSLM